MREEFYSRADLAHYLESLPTEQAMEVVITMLTADKNNSEFVEKLFPVRIENAQQEPTTAEKIQALEAWIKNYSSDAPPLSDEAIGRESIYSHERL